MPRTVLFISHSSALYGAERSLLDLLSGLDRSAYRAIVALPEDGPLNQRITALGIETWITGHQKWIGGRHVWFAMWYRLILNSQAYFGLRTRLKKTPVDLIYTNTSAVPIGGVLAQRLHIPHIWHIREFVPNQGTSGNFYYGDARSFRFIDRTSSHIICNSRYIETLLRDTVSPDKVSVVYNGLLPPQPGDVQPRQTPPSLERLNLCIVGSLEKKKGQEDAVQVMRLLIDQGVRATLQIAGEGRQKDYLQHLAKELGLENHIEWLGFVDNPAAVYREADIALVCSRSEPFGRIAVEAAAYGCPVVSTNLGGLQEIVIERETGLFYTPGDIKALSKQILFLVENPSSFLDYSKNAIRSVYERFGMTRYVNDIERSIDRLLQEERI